MINRVLGTMLGQILAIIAASSALTFLLFLLLLSAVFPAIPPPPPWPWPNAYRIAALVDSIRIVPVGNRAALIAAATRPDLSLWLPQASLPCTGLTRDALDMQMVLQVELREPLSDLAVHSCGIAALNPLKNIQILVRLGNQVLEIRTGRIVGPRPFFGGLPVVGALLFLCVAVAAMSAWAVWRVIGPLRRLSEKADRFGREFAVSAIDEEGPQEIRRAARAFNLMQERIARSVRDRTRMLAAISHDLRTPLTRMRLQLEIGSPDTMRGKILRDVDLMQSMVASALTFLSGSLDEEEKEWFDLGALLLTLCDEFEESGVTIGYEGPQQISFFCRPNAMTRALTNLIENACHFGNKVMISASLDSEAVVIDVADDGPGIPAQSMQDVIEPFVRLDPARSNRPGGVGLGLSIVKEIVQAHGGTLVLIGRQPKGLIARITLPVVARANAAS